MSNKDIKFFLLINNIKIKQLYILFIKTKIRFYIPHIENKNLVSIICKGRKLNALSCIDEI